MNIARRCFWVAVLFCCVSATWWGAHWSSWWVYGLSVTAGLLLAQFGGDIKSWVRKHRPKRRQQQAVRVRP